MPSTAGNLITVLVSDPTLMGCELLAGALERASNRIQVTARAVTVDEILNAATTLPDVALISADLRDGRLGGFRALRDLHAYHSATRPVMLLDSDDRELIIAAFRGGARGVYYRTQPFESLSKCIQTVHEGEVWASNTEVQFMLEALATVAPLRTFAVNNDPLTRREEQVARLVAQGLTNREISRRLNLSEHTIKNYLFRTFEKLGVSNRVELALHLSNQTNRTAA